MTETSVIASNTAPLELGSSRTGILTPARERVLLLACYAVLLVLTSTTMQGDTVYYAHSIVERSNGTGSTFWEFGHMLWRPLGYLAVTIVSLVDRPLSQPELLRRTLVTLMGLVVVFGALAIVAFHTVVGSVLRSRAAVLLATLTFMLAHAFLNYVHTGAAYVPALAMLVLCLAQLLRHSGGSDLVAGILAGLALAASVLFWAPMIFAAPTPILALIFLRDRSRRTLILGLSTTLVSVAVAGAATLIFAAAAGVRSIGQLLAWVSSSSHGIAGTGGFARMVLGFGRSLMDVEQLGLLTKRFLLHDAYNTVKLTDLVRSGMAELVLVYLLLAVLLLPLARSAWGRRVLGFLAAACLPVLVFALRWQGGDLERYLGLFPALFLAVGVGIDSLWQRAPSDIETVATSRRPDARVPGWRLLVGAALGCAFAIFNIPPLVRGRVVAQCDRIGHRIEAIPLHQGSEALAFTPYYLDEPAAYEASCPVAAARVLQGRQVVGLVMPGVNSASDWQTGFRQQVDSAWRRGVSVWLSETALDPRPPRESKWAEGERKDVQWAAFPSFFSQFELRRLTTGAEVARGGFLEIPPTALNRSIVAGNHESSR